MSESDSTEPNTGELLERLSRSLRSAAGRNRRTLALPGFELFLADTDAYFLNLAVPVGNPSDGDTDWRMAVAGLTAAFGHEGRRPRLEFFAEVHPGLAAALEAAGYRLEQRAPVMVLEPSGFAAPSVQLEGYRRLKPDDPGLEPFLRRQGVAYGGSEADEPVFLPGLRAGLADGSVWAAGLERGGGFASGATLQLGDVDGGMGEERAAELAGVWTHPDYRRCGLAFVVCRHLLTEYFAAGHGPAWLSAAPSAQGLYKRLGFREVGTQLNYGSSRADSDETR